MVYAVKQQRKGLACSAVQRQADSADVLRYMQGPRDLWSFPALRCAPEGAVTWREWRAMVTTMWKPLTCWAALIGCSVFALGEFVYALVGLALTTIAKEHHV
jgi:hypothetical protein